MGADASDCVVKNDVLECFYERLIFYVIPILQQLRYKNVELCHCLLVYLLM